MEKISRLKILAGPDAPKGGMGRREMVRRLLGGAGLGYATPLIAASHPIYKHLADAATLSQADARTAEANWKPVFLDPHQSATLEVLAERIVPGSTEAKVTPFVDLLLSVDTQDNQRKFLASLGAFEGEAIGRYGRPYKDLAEAQQNEILTAASTAAPGTHAGEAKGRRRAMPSVGNDEPGPATLRDHFENMKGWVSGAYYSSEIGMKDLGWTGQVIFESFPGCQHPEGHQ